MKRVALIGYGELGKQILALAKAIYNVEEVIAFDDVQFKNWDNESEEIVYYPFSYYKKDQFKEYSFFICLGYKHLVVKKSILDWLINHNYDLPALIHPTSFINQTAKVGKAVYIYPMCNIDKGVNLDNGVLLNNSVVVSHDTNVGKCSYLSPGVITSGLVKIGECTFIGTGVIVSNGITIGKNVIVGLGTVVTKNLIDGSSSIGNPIKTLSRKLNLL